MDIKIAVAAHKSSILPVDRMYIPVQAGALGKDSIYENRDDVGENISEKNPYYSELTVLYYAWKNWDYDILGLVHYRRYFTLKTQLFINNNYLLDAVLHQNELERIMQFNDIVVPGKRNYHIETIYSHYGHTFTTEHLDVAKQVISERHPEYLKYVDQVYNNTSAHMMNMFIMKKEFVDEYCTFLFDVLENMEDKIDTTGMDDFQKRLYGRVSEILFNVWLLKRMDQGAKVRELKLIHTDPIKWGHKIVGFLAAKFLNKKYKQSF